MEYSIEAIIDLLKKARKKKGISQEELGQKMNIPQSHISKIESGKIDLQTSNLLEIARLLDLELMLIPRQQVPMIKALLNESDADETAPRYRLDGDHE